MCDQRKIPRPAGTEVTRRLLVHISRRPIAVTRAVKSCPRRSGDASKIPQGCKHGQARVVRTFNNTLDTSPRRSQRENSDRVSCRPTRSLEAYWSHGVTVQSTAIPSDYHLHRKMHHMRLEAVTSPRSRGVRTTNTTFQAVQADPSQIPFENTSTTSLTVTVSMPQKASHTLRLL